MRFLICALFLSFIPASYAAPKPGHAKIDPNTMVRLTNFAHLWELNLVRHAPSPKTAAVSRVLNRVYVVSSKQAYEFTVQQLWPTPVILYDGQNITKYPYETDGQYQDRLEKIFPETKGRHTSVLDLIVPAAYADWTSFGLGVGAGWIANQVYGSSGGGRASYTVTNNTYVDFSGLEYVLQQDNRIKEQIAELLKEQNEELRIANTSKSLDRSSDSNGAKALDQQVIQRYLQKSFGNDNLDFLRNMILRDPHFKGGSCKVNDDKTVTSKVVFELGGKKVEMGKNQPSMGVENLDFRIEGGDAVRVKTMTSFSHPGQDDVVQVCKNGSCKPAASALDVDGLAQKNPPALYTPYQEASAKSQKELEEWNRKVWYPGFRSKGNDIGHERYDTLGKGGLDEMVFNFRQKYLPKEPDSIEQDLKDVLSLCLEKYNAVDAKRWKDCLDHEKTGTYFSPTQKDKALKSLYSNYKATDYILTKIRKDKVATGKIGDLRGAMDETLRKSVQEPLVQRYFALAAINPNDACTASEGTIRNSFQDYLEKNCKEANDWSDFYAESRDGVLSCATVKDGLLGNPAPGLMPELTKMMSDQCAHKKAMADREELKRALAFSAYQYRCCQYQICASYMDALAQSKSDSGGSAPGEKGEPGSGNSAQ